MYRNLEIKRHRYNIVPLCISVLLILASAACGKDSTTSPPSPPASPTPTPHPPPPPVPVATRIEIGPERVNLTAIGQTAQIQATVLDQNGAAMSDASVSWSSDNTAVVSVNATGLVRAVGNGMAQVTARSGSLSARVAVTVSQAVTRIVVSPDSSTMRAIGDSLTLVVTLFDSGGNAVTGDDTAVTWRSSDEDVATVTSEGMVEAAGNGTAQITARSGSVTAVATVTVEQRVFRIVISPSEYDFTEQDETFQFEAEAFDANGHGVEEAGLTWRTSDETVATVDSAGLVTARGDGTAVISVHRDDVSASASVNVMLPGADMAALVRFYESTGGPGWTRNTNWLSDRPLDEWYGVTVDDDERVTRLTLFSNNLTGTLPSDIGQLTKLFQLSLRDNGLTGPVPPALGLLPELSIVDLAINQLSGEIPPELGRSPSLIGLQLSYNQLSGEIPAELGQLATLRQLQLNDNQLTGQIPPELGRLTELRSFFIDYNMLSGPIPPTLGNLENVHRLELNHNRLTGEIPPELGKMSGLTQLFLNNNMLTGALPEELGDLPELFLISVGVNPDLAGPLPRSFLDLDLRFLRLEGTRLCVPSDDAFRAWLEGIGDRRAVYCRPENEEQ